MTTRLLLHIASFILSEISVIELIILYPISNLSDYKDWTPPHLTKNSTQEQQWQGQTRQRWIGMFYVCIHRTTNISSTYNWA